MNDQSSQPATGARVAKSNKSEAILKTAARLTKAQNGTGWTMADLARTCGLGKVTPYLYFSTKALVLSALLHHEIEIWVLMALSDITADLSPAEIAARLWQSAEARPVLALLLDKPGCASRAAPQCLNHLAQHLAITRNFRLRRASVASLALYAALAGAFATGAEAAQPHASQAPQTIFVAIATALLKAA